MQHTRDHLKHGLDVQSYHLFMSFRGAANEGAHQNLKKQMYHFSQVHRALGTNPNIPQSLMTPPSEDSISSSTTSSSTSSSAAATTSTAATAPTTTTNVAVGEQQRPSSGPGLWDFTMMAAGAYNKPLPPEGDFLHPASAESAPAPEIFQGVLNIPLVSKH